jgi:hypothetical protein
MVMLLMPKSSVEDLISKPKKTSPIDFTLVVKGELEKSFQFAQSY